LAELWISLQVEVHLPVLVFAQGACPFGDLRRQGAGKSFALPEKNAQGQASLAHTARKAMFCFGQCTEGS
jgi:hypothetical protein